MSINIDVLNRDSNIKATVICDSINNQGVRITTIEAEYPRFCHSELMTHRMFSRNASSSRAVPLPKAIEQIEGNMAMPLYWGANQGGMVAGGEVSEKDRHWAKTQWRYFAKDAIENSKVLSEMINVHKQHAARLIEPFQMIKVLITATEWDNFFNLRIHPDAQPEICQLAYKIYLAMQDSKPILLNEGEWHLPYIDRIRWHSGDLYYSISNGHGATDGIKMLSKDEAIKLSASCSAQTSYRKHDTSIDKANDIFEKLIKSDVVHSSPFEHLATPASDKVATYYHDSLEAGITHIDTNSYRWSGNLREWISYRHTMPNNTCNKFNFEKRMELFK